jgi:hypothetical protein
MSQVEIVKDRIKEILCERPGITHGQLVEVTGLAKNTVTKYLRIIRAEWEKAIADNARNLPFQYSRHVTPEIEAAVGEAMLAEARGPGAKKHQIQTPAREASQAKVAAGIERRRATIAKLHAAGMDDRAIADALGMSCHTIRADMRAIGVL